MELQIQWKYNIELQAATNARLAAAANRKKNSLVGIHSSIVNLIRGKQDDDDDDEYLYSKDTGNGDDDDEDLAAPESTAAKTKEDEEEKKKIEEELKKQIGDTQIKDGDYQIQVHIIEARDLKAENLNGSSDPVVYVECFDQKQHTQTLKGYLFYLFILCYLFVKK